MIRCEAPNCKMRAYNLTKEQMKLAKNNYIVSFHKFPDDPEQRTAWIEAAQKKDWNPPDNGSLCSLHFRDDCFNDNNELYDHALPRIFFNDFRSHIRGIVKEFDLECGFSDDEPEDNQKVDQGYKIVEENSANDSEEIIECKLSEDEGDANIVEREKVPVGKEKNKPGIEDIPIIESTVVTTEPVKQPAAVHTECKKKPVYKPGPISSKLKEKNVAKSSIPPKKVIEKIPEKSTQTTKSSNVDNDVICIDPVPKPLTNNPIKSTVPSVRSTEPKKAAPCPSTTSSSQQASGGTSKKLIDLLKPSSLTKFSVLEPASRSLVIQLLNIVQMANTRNDVNSPNANTPSTYIITTKQENKDGVYKEPMKLESAVIVQTVTNLVKDIKKETYSKKDDISIICGSPAIFFIKNVTVKNCDPNMNSIYVVTSENLLPYIYKLHANKPKQGQLLTQRTLVKQTPSEGQKIVNTTNVQPTNKSVPPVSSSHAFVHQDVIKSPINSSSNLKTPSTQTFHSSVNATKGTTYANTANLKSQAPKASTSTPVSITYSYTSTSSKLQLPHRSSPGSTGITKVNTSFASSTAIKGKTFSTGSPNVTRLTTPATPPAPISQLNKAPIARVVPPSKPSTTILSPLLANAPSITLVTTSAPTSTASKLRMLTSTSKATFYSPNSPEMQFRPSPLYAKRGVPTVTSTTTSPIVIPSTSIKSVIKPQAMPIKSSLPATKSYQPAPIITPTSIPMQKSPSPEFIFKPIQAKTFNTKLAKSPELLYPCSPVPSTSKETPSLKRKWEEIEEIDDDDDIIIEYPPNNEIDDREYIYEQEKEIEALEENILQKERDINNLKKKISYLRKRLNQVKNPQDTKTDEQLVEEILSKYLDSDGVQFFVGQMKVSGKTYTQFRWSEEDKLFALSLLYKNPIEYNILFQKYTLPSDKTLNKFVTRIKKAEMGDTGSAE